MNNFCKIIKYIWVFLLLLSLNLITFLYQEEVYVMKINNFQDLIESSLFYSIIFMIFFTLIYLSKNLMSKEFIKYNLIFPWLWIVIGIIFYLTGLSNKDNATELIKIYDFFLILGYIAFILSKNKNKEHL